MTLQCDICFGNFANYLICNNICKFCTTRIELQKELTLERSYRVELQDKVNVLEAKLNSIIDKNHQNHPQADIIFNENTFTTVKNKKQARNVKQGKFSMELSNKFEVLNNNEDLNSIILGDSQLRNIGTIINYRKKKGSKKKNLVTCYPGADTKFITSKIQELQTDAEKTDLVIHIGGNNIRRFNDGKFAQTEEIIQSYKEVIEAAKLKGRKVVMMGIIPRRLETNEWHSRAIAINDRIKSICRNQLVNFIDVWEAFTEDESQFQRKGVHLSNKGSNNLADIIIRSLNSIQGN